MPLTSGVSDRVPSESPACVPAVRLFAGRVLVTAVDGLSEVERDAVVPLLELSFTYGSTRVRACDERTRLFRSTGQGLETIERDTAAEREARRVLERFGALELACLDSVAPPAGCDAEYVLSIDSDPNAFCAFTANAVRELRALGWRIDIDRDYPFHVVAHEPSWFAHIEPASDRPDWFSLELGVEIDGERIDLLSLLLDMLEDLDGEGGLAALARTRRTTSALRVSETHHITVPTERLRAMLRVVAELYQGSRAGACFPAVRATALASLDEMFAGTGGKVVWSGLTDTADRARTLHASPTVIAPPAGLQATLRDYQLEGVAFLQRLGEAGLGGVLADEMGLGKTLQTIAHILTEKLEGRLDGPALIVGPTSLVTNWSRELARFAPALRVVVLHGDRRRERWPDVARADVVVTTYPVLVRDEPRFAEQRFHMVVLDEAQAIKNARTQARRALEHVSSQHRLCLTGTPVENHLGELWSIFDWLAPGLLGDELTFRRFWKKPIEEQGDAERLAALRDHIAPYVLRRLKRDVAKELPPKTTLLVPIELSGPERELYEAIRVAAHADVRRAIRAKGFAGSAITILDALTKLRQACCDPRLVAMDSARGVSGSSKLEALLELLEEQLANGHRALVFSQFTSMLALIGEALRARGVASLSLTGATRDRGRVVDAFEGGAADVFLISLKAGGTGLNLTSADTVVHYDPWWNPAAQSQATDRAYRMGQKRPVFVQNLYVAGSVEERVLGLQKKKLWLSSNLLADSAGAAPVSEGEIEELFAPLDA